MSSRFQDQSLWLAVLLALILTACQPIQPTGMALPVGNNIEQMKAEALQQELNSFGLMIAKQWKEYDAMTDPNFYQIGSDGAYIERAEMLTGLMDEKLDVHKPELGEMRVEMITPDAYMVTYPLNFNGVYDGSSFSNPRMVTSLWVKRDGKWFNAFLVDQIRTASLYRAEQMPAIVKLPDGFQPEGIAIGREATAYVSSTGSGAIYQINLATGEGKILVEPQATQKALGMVYDRRTDLLYVAGKEAGNGLVYNGLTGELVANVQLASDAKTLINDAALANDAVYFTDSNSPRFFKLPLSPQSHLPDPTASQVISLTGDFQYLPDGINSNGIVASSDGAKLIIAHTDLGKLYTVDAATGQSSELKLDGEVELYHDGLVLSGDTLYVVNYNNKVYVVELDPAWTTGTITHTITDPKLEAPATAARYNDLLFVVNARWDAEQNTKTEFWLTKVK